MDLRKKVEKMSHVSCGSPLLCSQTDGETVAAGAQDGQVRMPCAVIRNKHSFVLHTFFSCKMNSLACRWMCTQITLCLCFMQIFFWEFGQQSNQSTSRSSALASSAVQSMHCGPNAACNSLVLEWLPSRQSTLECLHIVSAHENGSVLHQKGQ